MNFKKFFCAVFCVYFLVVKTEATQDKECTIPENSVFPFATQELDLSKEEFRSLIQAAVDVMYLRGFRYLGDPRDFDHGHMLYSAKPPLTPGSMPSVLAILYHTQEEAFYYNKKDPGSRFGYLDRWARNWLQWVDNKKVENARKYVLKNIDYDYELNHFTIHDDMLDHKRMGIAISPLYSKQFVFTDVTDKNIPYECRGDKSNLIVIKLPSGWYKILALEYK